MSLEHRSKAGEGPAHDKSGARSNYVAVARGRDLVVIRVVGRGNMLNAPGVQEFADEQREAGFTQFLFDLERCAGLDSTFMGVMVAMQQACDSSATLPAVHAAFESSDLSPMTPQEAVAALANEAAQAQAAGAGHSGTGGAGKGSASKPCTVSAVNVSPELLGLLKMLGVDNFIKIRGGYDLSKLETTILPEKTMSPAERSALIYEAHRALVDIDKRNEAQFGELLKSLERELRI